MVKIYVNNGTPDALHFRVLNSPEEIRITITRGSHNYYTNQTRRFSFLITAQAQRLFVSPRLRNHYLSFVNDNNFTAVYFLLFSRQITLNILHSPRA